MSRKKANLTPAQIEQHVDAWFAIHGATPGERVSRNEPKSQFPFVAHVLEIEPAISERGKRLAGTYVITLKDAENFDVHVKAKSRREALIAWLNEINFDDPEDLL